jgi:hypothetical protein
MLYFLSLHDYGWVLYNYVWFLVGVKRICFWWTFRKVVTKIFALKILRQKLAQKNYLEKNCAKKCSKKNTLKKIATKSMGKCFALEKLSQNLSGLCIFDYYIKRLTLWKFILCCCGVYNL